jgi:hypothetical protein
MIGDAIVDQLIYTLSEINFSYDDYSLAYYLFLKMEAIYSSETSTCLLMAQNIALFIVRAARTADPT